MSGGPSGDVRIELEGFNGLLGWSGKGQHRGNEKKECVHEMRGREARPRPPWGLEGSRVPDDPRELQVVVSRIWGKHADRESNPRESPDSKNPHAAT
jgi:hypothetical protein